MYAVKLDHDQIKLADMQIEKIVCRFEAEVQWSSTDFRRDT
jgi:hypothetical protein